MSRPAPVWITGISACTPLGNSFDEVARGLLAIGGGLFRLPRKIPANVATEMILTGSSVSATRMHELGFVNHLTVPGQTRHAARALATQIAASSPVAVQAALEVSSSAVADGWADSHGWRAQREPFARVLNSEDLVEGLRAFAEKRTAQWKGR